MFHDDGGTDDTVFCSYQVLKNILTLVVKLNVKS